ncbi:hypothetical protein S83_014473 [Arachis hypogaea]|nr:uncharacterized protein DS421_5g134970 [Arachis hypogaea]
MAADGSSSFAFHSLCELLFSLFEDPLFASLSLSCLASSLHACSCGGGNKVRLAQRRQKRPLAPTATTPFSLLAFSFSLSSAATTTAAAPRRRHPPLFPFLHPISLFLLSILFLSSVLSSPFPDLSEAAINLASFVLSLHLSAYKSLSATNPGLPKSPRFARRTGFTTTPMLLLPILASRNKAVAPA